MFLPTAATVADAESPSRNEAFPFLVLIVLGNICDNPPLHIRNDRDSRVRIMKSAHLFSNRDQEIASNDDLE